MSKQSKKSLAKIMDQYVVVRALHEQFVSGKEQPITVSLKVQRADPSLMYKRADNVRGGNHFVCRTGGQNGTREEFAYWVSNGRLGEKMAWENKSQRQYVKDYRVWPDYESVNYIIWMTVYEWFEKTSDEEERLGMSHGKHREWEIEYTVYLPPADGFRALIDRSRLTRNVELTERIINDGLIREEDDFTIIHQKLWQLAKRFESEVYNQGLMELIAESKKRGMSAQLGGVNVMSFVMCGRLMITMEAANPDDPKLRDSFTIIGDEPPTYPSFGWRSIFATVDRAQEIVADVVRVWESLTPGQRAEIYRDNKDVRLNCM